MANRQTKYRTRVVRGYGRGKSLGFPTLNLEEPKPFPHEYGIYAGYVWLGRKKYQGAFHYGPIPTFGQRKASLEVFLLDRRRDVTADEVSFEMVQYLRPIVAFRSEAELFKQIGRDVEQVKAVLIPQPRLFVEKPSSS